MSKGENQDSNAILAEVTGNMRLLYNEVRAGGTDLRMADSLANIAGKVLKSEQLRLAREIFVQEKIKLPAPGA